MIITHCSRKKDLEHTSWAEIQAFHDICLDNRIFSDLELRDHVDLEKCVFAGDMTVFATGADMNETVVELANSCRNLYIVAQDPNWPTSLHQITRPFHLITPFTALKSKTLDEVKSILIDMIPTLHLENMVSHSVISFGTMMAYDKAYVLRYLRYLRRSDVKTVKDRSVYAGSLKQDRVKELAKYATENAIDFVGNFTEAQFCEAANLQSSQLKDARFFGRVESTKVPALYSGYKNVLFVPDEKIEKLGTSYVRIAEMCLARAGVALVEPRQETLQYLSQFMDSSRRMSWSKFIDLADGTDLIGEIRQAYGEVAR